MWLVLSHFDNHCSRPPQTKPFPSFLPEEAGEIPPVLSSDSNSFIAWATAHPQLFRDSISVNQEGNHSKPPDQSLL